MHSRRWVVLAALWSGAVACSSSSGEPGPRRDDAAIDCSEEALHGGDEEFAFTSAYVVDDGDLGALCFGTDDETVLDAWESLATITPDGQLGDLVLFGGFEPAGDLAADTLAFVNAVDSDASGFQMSINTDEAARDPDELLLTLAHEFTHVFTATPEQLDRTDEAIDGCGTYFNGEGCYRAESLMYDWIIAFWDPSVLATVDPNEESVDDADARCADDDGFFGTYAASNPEEDSPRRSVPSSSTSRRRPTDRLHGSTGSPRNQVWSSSALAPRRPA